MRLVFVVPFRLVCFEVDVCPGGFVVSPFSPCGPCVGLTGLYRGVS